eukprot:CAMPEP_0119477350 /NCGR_PEP_ID=MMETSP1344-20130328/7521_1 /TAXON_ID=236787 /ORGANISM="Florenciella parvula, Strain CCMP2471" /LENGTH=61 /DNA_ID=CAMNT_0007511311 /DNA_START=537 /DNA_END=719 /DNA_ORIENTATION=+
MEQRVERAVAAARLNGTGLHDGQIHHGDDLSGLAGGDAAELKDPLKKMEANANGGTAVGVG